MKNHAVCVFPSSAQCGASEYGRRTLLLHGRMIIFRRESLAFELGRVGCSSCEAQSSLMDHANVCRVEVSVRSLVKRGQDSHSVESSCRNLRTSTVKRSRLLAISGNCTPCSMQACQSRRVGHIAAALTAMIL